MKKIISVVSLTLIGFTSYSMAADTDKGEKYSPQIVQAVMLRA